MSPGAPYREPAPPPTSPPERRWPVALSANVGIAVVLGIGLATCNEYGCSSRHLNDGVALGAGVASVAVTIKLATVAIRKLTTRALRPDGTRPPMGTGATVGVVLTTLFTIGSVLLDVLSWIAAAQPSVGIGFGGWGRPLRVGRRAITPDVKASDEWARGPRPDPAGLDPTTRAVLRDLWLHDARKEHASVPAFGRVARQLVTLGAPADLVRRAHVASLQEIDHAERCFALASAYAGEDLGVQPMPALGDVDDALPRARVRALELVATEALVDGALLEDFNAELARTALDDVRDPACREALEHIVEDEAEHAALAWDILAWCVREGGAPVAAALTAREARLGEDPESLYDPALAARVAALPDRAPLYAHGRVRDDRVADVFRARRAIARARLAAILGKPEAPAARAPRPAA